jgi:hypothetical protein
VSWGAFFLQEAAWVVLKINGKKSVKEYPQASAGGDKVQKVSPVKKTCRAPSQNALSLMRKNSLCVSAILCHQAWKLKKLIFTLWQQIPDTLFADDLIG